MFPQFPHPRVFFTRMTEGTFFRKEGIKKFHPTLGCGNQGDITRSVMGNSRQLAQYFVVGMFHHGLRQVPLSEQGVFWRGGENHDGGGWMPQHPVQCND